MKTFYAVTDGDYSDYHIIAITDNKERAENIKKLYRSNYSEPMIEEFYDSEVKDQTTWLIWAKSNGEFESNRISNNRNDINKIREAAFGSCFKYSVLVFAKDENYAIKIAQDLWAEYKAKKEGIV